MDPLLLKEYQEIDVRYCDIAEGQGDSSWQAFRSYVGFFCDCNKNVVFGCIGDFVAKIRYCIITWNTDLE